MLAEAAGAGVITGVGKTEFNLEAALGWFALHGTALESDLMQTLIQLNLIGSAMHAQNCIYGDDGSWPYSSSAGGSGVTLGQQYSPGDYTGGETVDFATGRGNGGASICGTAGHVEYLAVEVYNDVTHTWEVWAAGYAVVC